MDPNEKNLFKIEQIKKFLKEAFHVSINAHEILFRNSHNKQNELIAAVSLNKAVSIMYAAKAIYYSDYEELENTYVEQIFHLFDVFENEFITNLTTDHSHQWTDIEFHKYEDEIKSFLDV